MEKNQTIIYPSDSDSMRLDVFLTDYFQVSRSQVQKWIKQEHVLVNGKFPKKAGDFLKSGDTISMVSEGKYESTEKRDEEYERLKNEIVILHDEKDFLVVYKPAGLLVHPTEALEENTLTHFLLEKYPKLKGIGENPVRPGIVHRLDREASGILVIAKTKKMFEHLKKQFQERTIEKIYSVLVYGEVDQDHNIIDFDIDRGKDGKMVSRPNTDLLSLKKVQKRQPGKEAITEFWVEKRFVNYSLLRVKIHTGRTHQIRVHMYAYNHPVVGDNLYCNKKLCKKRDRELKRLFLHAKELSFTDLKGEKRNFEYGLPEDLQSFLDNAK
ncbi:MAG: RluA family pseudouridine synthase [Candidatus Magasanikbacteria bacterium]